MDYYILLRLFTFLHQVDAVNSVKEIGFYATAGLILVGLLVWGVRQLFAYFTTRLDKKDDRIAEQQDKHSEAQAKMLDDRRGDLLQIRETISIQAQAQRELAQAQVAMTREQAEGFKMMTAGLQALADEVRRGK
jgi:hypothetical protein